MSWFYTAQNPGLAQDICREVPGKRRRHCGARARAVRNQRAAAHQASLAEALKQPPVLWSAHLHAPLAFILHHLVHQKVCFPLHRAQRWPLWPRQQGRGLQRHLRSMRVARGCQISKPKEAYVRLLSMWLQCKCALLIKIDKQKLNDPLI